MHVLLYVLTCIAVLYLVVRWSDLAAMRNWQMWRHPEPYLVAALVMVCGYTFAVAAH